MPNSVNHEVAIMVKTLWDATAALATDCAGGLRYELFKQPADSSALTEPYCVMKIKRARPPVHCTGSDTILYRTVRFQVYGDEAAAATAAGRIRATFARATLANPTGGYFMHCLESDEDASIEFWARDSKMKWQAEWICEIAVCMS